jgi:hypothetical protein
MFEPEDACKTILALLYVAIANVNIDVCAVLDIVSAAVPCRESPSAAFTPVILPVVVTF